MLNNLILSSVVLSACFSALIGSIIYFKSKQWQSIFYCGCFIGMSSNVFLDKVTFWLISILVASLTYSFYRKYFNGYGGRLGAIAFIGSSAGAMVLWIS